MIYRGKVAQITSRGIMVEIADLGAGMVFGPCETVAGTLSVGEFVLCMQVTGAMEDIVIVGKLQQDQVSENVDGEGTTIGFDLDGVPFYNISISADGYTVLEDVDGVPYLEDTPAGHRIQIDTDGIPYYAVVDNAVDNTISIDEEGVPYYDISGTIGSVNTILYDIDGVPYFELTNTGDTIRFDVDGEPYIADAQLL
jgi:hypothetical protein